MFKDIRLFFNIFMDTFPNSTYNNDVDLFFNKLINYGIQCYPSYVSYGGHKLDIFKSFDFNIVYIALPNKLNQLFQISTSNDFYSINTVLIYNYDIKKDIIQYDSELIRNETPKIITLYKFWKKYFRSHQNTKLKQIIEDEIYYAPNNRTMLYNIYKKL